MLRDRSGRGTIPIHLNAPLNLCETARADDTHRWFDIVNHVNNHMSGTFCVNRRADDPGGTQRLDSRYRGSKMVAHRTCSRVLSNKDVACLARTAALTWRSFWFSIFAFRSDEERFPSFGSTVALVRIDSASEMKEADIWYRFP